MTIFKANIELILPLIAALALLSAASSQPSRSAIIIFLEAIAINVYLAFTQGITSAVFGSSILLTFFCMITIGSCHYFEVSFKRTVSKPPILNLLLCIILFFLFWRYAIDAFSSHEPVERLYFLNLNYDALSTIVAGFTLFAILVASLIIFDLKNPRPGDHT